MNELIEFLWAIAPVVVHVADEHGVEGVEVSAEHSKLIQDEQLSLLVVPFTVSLQQLLFSYNLRLKSIDSLFSSLFTPMDVVITSSLRCVVILSI